VVAQKQFAENAGKFSKSFDPKREWYSIFPRVKVPTLLLVSENGIMTRSEASEYVLAFGAARYEYIEAAGHIIHFDNFEVFMSTVRAFLG
jgi:pimeloyl-ACP methyl ester carboxylesterase